MVKNINRLIMLTMKGDRESFGCIYNNYSEKIYRFIYYRTFHRETAEDLTGQTFLYALEYLKSFDPDKGSFSSWLYKIAFNCIRRHFNKNKHTDNCDDLWDIKSDVEFEIDIEQKMLYEKIQPVLQSLPAEKRKIVIMRIWDELPYKDIARIMDKNEASCRMIFSRTMEELRSLLPGIAVIMLCLIIKR